MSGTRRSRHKAGRVAVAWDSYRNGNYDVYARTWSNSWAGEVPIAASARYEAYPSIAFDPKGRLWVAYEEGGAGWGQDFGAYASPGIALYRGRAIRLRALEPDGRLVTIQSSIDKNLIGIPSARPDTTGSQLDGEPRDPDTQSATTRKPDQAPEGGVQTTAKNTLPRLTIDDSGRMSIAFRTAHPIWWSPIGTVWSEYVISFDGKQWSKPIYLDHSDNLLDNRPALLATAGGTADRQLLRWPPQICSCELHHGRARRVERSLQQRPLEPGTRSWPWRPGSPRGCALPAGENAFRAHMGERRGQWGKSHSRI